MKNDTVAVVGSINYDIIFKQKRLPEIGETYSADSVSFCGGGKGANQAVQCAKLGLETYMVGKVGNDAFGKEMLRNLSSYGVNLDHVAAVDSNTGLGVVNALENGSVIATISKGANYHLTREDIDRSEEVLRRSKIVVLQLEVPKDVVEYTIKLAKKHDSYVILNAAPASELEVECLKMVDCLVVNETEAGFYAGTKVASVEDAEAVCEKLALYANDLLVITLGEKGSILYSGNTLYRVPSEKVDAVETTGAGDSYVGALAYSLIHKKSPEEIGAFSSLVSSRTVMKIGAQNAMPTLSEVLENINN
ncbi:ribokinase [Mesobacillus jeotgali]|uniref:ribokinase n=1 Tax=Mesobacillus jeotgali TaxID=129985 RepID=UPI000C81C0D7|nr:ribokinase [Mesobacillus jeotgali]